MARPPRGGADGGRTRRKGEAARPAAPEAEVERLREELARTSAELAVARQRLVGQARLFALGRLVAGVAHELNNPANFIYGGSVALDERLDAWPEGMRGESYDEVRRLVAVIRTGGERARDLMESLLSFSRSSAGDRARFSLAAAARSTVALLEPWARRRGVTVELEVAEELEVEGRRAEVSQVVMNLLTNAIQASGAGAVVRVTVARRGDEAVVAVADDGPGVPPELVDRIFEPFFTTKPAGEGNGLGLAISRSIAAEQGGRVELDNEPGTGATFSVVVPLAPGGRHG